MAGEMADHLSRMREGVLACRMAQQQAMKQKWERPLAARVARARALGPLRYVKTTASKTGSACWHFRAPEEDFAVFQEGQRLRLSQDSPQDDYLPVYFGGLGEEGLVLYPLDRGERDPFARDVDGWCLDEDFFDLSQHYLDAIEQLGETAHGREVVYPALFEENRTPYAPGVFAQVSTELEDEAEGKLDAAQLDAVAISIASQRFSLVQGPPGTGKTYTLAWLVKKLVDQGQRVLITGFTHRAIHNALDAVQSLLDGLCPVVKISQPLSWTGDESFPIHESFDEAGLSLEGPWVVGATPYALNSKRLMGVDLDVAVIDETSQLPLMAALIIMLRTQRWHFFGDPKQLGPVSVLSSPHEVEQSAFKSLERHLDPEFLRWTYRMNGEITHWASECFYSGWLESRVADARMALKRSPGKFAALLDPEHALVRVEVAGSARSQSFDRDEAGLVAAVIDELFRCGMEGRDIGVVTPFRAQARQVHGMLAKSSRASGFAAEAKAVLIDTVDRFQGQEREVIVITLASRQRAFITQLMDFILQENRLNVAVTRARTKVVLVHSQALLAMAEEWEINSPHAAAFANLCRSCERIDMP